MDVKGKTKDNHKAIMDVAEFCARGDLELVQLGNGKLTKPKANYNFTIKYAKSFYKWITKLKMSDGYASNIARCANIDKRGMHGMKSHDCHEIIMFSWTIYYKLHFVHYQNLSGMSLLK